MSCPSSAVAPSAAAASASAISSSAAAAAASTAADATTAMIDTAPTAVDRPLLPSLPSAPALSTHYVSLGFSPVTSALHTDFTPLYRCRTHCDDTVIHLHGNGVCALALAPTHPLRRLRADEQITSLQWQGMCRTYNSTGAAAGGAGGGGHRQGQERVTGKRKKGAIALDPNSILCTVTTSSDVVYTLRANVHGRLLELNALLPTRPSLLASEPHKRGYIALLLVQPNMRKRMVSADRRQEGADAERDLSEKLIRPRSDDAVEAERIAAAEGEEEDKSWQQAIRYYTPTQYQQRRKEFFNVL